MFSICPLCPFLFCFERLGLGLNVFSPLDSSKIVSPRFQLTTHVESWSLNQEFLHGQMNETRMLDHLFIYCPALALSGSDIKSLIPKFKILAWDRQFTKYFENKFFESKLYNFVNEKFCQHVVNSKQPVTFWFTYSFW